MKTAGFVVLGVALLAAACAGKRVDDESLRVMENGDRVPSNEGPVRAAAHTYEADRAATEEARAAILADALATCAGSICEAVTRGEVALGMNRVQVLAATGTTESAWQIRD